MSFIHFNIRQTPNSFLITIIFRFSFHFENGTQNPEQLKWRNQQKNKNILVHQSVVEFVFRLFVYRKFSNSNHISYKMNNILFYDDFLIDVQLNHSNQMVNYVMVWMIGPMKMTLMIASMAMITTYLHFILNIEHTLNVLSFSGIFCFSVILGYTCYNFFFLLFFVYLK